ncbi:MAG TPA: AAA family ATPase [Longimicrobiales bacterium]|nr:AAA family ATPase [Longimicrobiales bacterium]
MARPTVVATLCSPSDVLRALELTPPDLMLMLWGPPGVGKSDIMRQFAERHGYRFVKLPLASMEASDLIGLPDLTHGLTTFAPPSLLWELTAAAETERRRAFDEAKAAGELASDAEFQPTRALLCLDEIPQMSVQLMHGVAALILDRTIGFGGLRLAAGVRLVGAGNREQDGAFANTLGTHFRSRIIHLEMGSTLPDWRNYARGVGIAPEIIAFLGSRPRYLHDFDPRSSDRTFAAPRTWEFASRILHSVRAAGGEDQQTLKVLLEGTVGPAAAAEFLAFLESAAKCPSAEEVVADPERAPTFRERPDMALVVVENLVMACRTDPVFVDGTLQYLKRLPSEYQSIASMALLVEDGPAEMKRAVLASPHFSVIRREAARADQVLMRFDKAVNA